MVSFFKALKTRIIGFQGEIVKIKQDLHQAEEHSQKEQKKLILEQLEWFDALNMIIEDVRSDEASGNTGLIIKSLERLKNKMQRHFTSISISLINPVNALNDISSDVSSIKVVSTLSDLNIADGTIVETLRKGYKWKNQVIRKTEVVTIKNTSLNACLFLIFFTFTSSPRIS